MAPNDEDPNDTDNGNGNGNGNTNRNMVPSSSLSSSSSSSSSSWETWSVMAAAPIVWISIVSVATTGGGLPAGPFGLVGAVEGISYLVVVGVAAMAIFSPLNNDDDDDGADDGDDPPLLLTTRTVSLATLGLAVLVLVKLVTDQGCIPNAKPILDYSNYVRVCDPHHQTPGFFGGGGGGE